MVVQRLIRKKTILEILMYKIQPEIIKSKIFTRFNFKHFIKYLFSTAWAKYFRQTLVHIKYQIGKSSISIFYEWDTSASSEVSNCDGVVLEIYLDHRFQWPQGGLGCESVA